MEEWVGARWHNFISQRVLEQNPGAAVALGDCRASLSTLYRALVAPEAARQLHQASERVLPLGHRWWARLATDNQRRALPWLDDEGLHLPASLDWFEQRSLNLALYRWWVLLAAELSSLDAQQSWAQRCALATGRLFARFPSTRALYDRLLKAHLPQRPDPAHLSAADAALERAIRMQLAEPQTEVTFPAAENPPWPIALWVYPRFRMPQQKTAQEAGAEPASGKGSEQAELRKQTDQARGQHKKHGLLLFRLENLFSWSESVDVNREVDDQPSDDDQRVAEDLDTLTLTDQGNPRSAVRVDMDLPAAALDDLPLGEGEWYPEYHWREAALVPDRVCIQPFAPRLQTQQPDIQHLHGLIRRVRAQFQSLRTERLHLRHQQTGDELDLPAWVDFQADRRAGHCPEPALYQSQRLQLRDIATLVLADLSMSTDAYVSEQQRVIDVMRDGLQVLSAALDGAGDSFALYGFSSLGRASVRMSEFKTFSQPFNSTVVARLASIRPGYYTRMGAAIRRGSDLLRARPQSKRLLLLISDGKPNDREHYEGRFGLEDTRAAITEARALGCLPFCITIDKQAQDYLPFLFGRQGYCVVQNPAQLAFQLTWIYRRLTG